MESCGWVPNGWHFNYIWYLMLLICSQTFCIYLIEEWLMWPDANSVVSDSTFKWLLLAFSFLTLLPIKSILLIQIWYSPHLKDYMESKAKKKNVPKPRNYISLKLLYTIFLWSRLNYKQYLNYTHTHPSLRISSYNNITR